MRSGSVIIAVILIIFGVALISVSISLNPNFNGTGSKIFPASKYTVYDNGVYVTRIPPNLTSYGMNGLEFAINSTSSSFPGTEQYALVPVSKLPLLNASNYMEFNVAQSRNTTQDVSFYNVPPGSYAYVTPQNNVLTFVVTPETNEGLVGIVGGIGLFISIAGCILLAVRTVLRPRMGAKGRLRR